VKDGHDPDYKHQNAALPPFLSEISINIPVTMLSAFSAPPRRTLGCPSSLSGFEPGLRLDALGGLGSKAAPEANAADDRESKQDTKGDAQTPDGFHLVTGGLGSTDPHIIVDGSTLSDVVPERRGKVIGGASGAANGRTVQEGQGLADCDSHNNDSDQEQAVHPGIDEERQDGIEV